MIRRPFHLGLLLIVSAVTALAQENAATARDGQHDFDWEFGNWHTHLWRLKQPLSGSNEWVEYDGTTVVRKIWDGLAKSAGKIVSVSIKKRSAKFLTRFERQIINVFEKTGPNAISQRENA